MLILASNEQLQQLLSSRIDLEPSQDHQMSFLIDSTANEDVTVTVGYNEQLPLVTLLNPDGTNITSLSPEYSHEASFKTVYLTLGDSNVRKSWNLNPLHALCKPE